LGDNGGCGWGVGEWVLFVLLRLGFGALRLNDALRRPKVRRRKATRLALLPGVDVIGKQPTFTLRRLNGFIKAYSVCSFHPGFIKSTGCSSLYV
jgi:hypothetical protein